MGWASFADCRTKDCAKLSRYVGWEGFELNFGRHISVAVLEIEAM